MAAKQTVLIVDDEPQVLDGLFDVLHRQYRVLRAGSGEEALELLASESVDVIICDEQMPGLDGGAVMEHARRSCPRVVRIILTGKASIRSAIHAIEDGRVYKYLHKPCRTADLIAAINCGILEQSLLLDGESAVEMSSTEQADLFETVARRR